MGGLLATARWTTQIGLGSVITWLFLLASLTVAILTIRSKLYTTERDRRVQLEDKLHEEQEIRHALRAENAALQLKSDLTPVLEGITAGFTLAIESISTTIRQEFREHEKQAQDRHQAQMKVAQAMVDKLNGRTS